MLTVPAEGFMFRIVGIDPGTETLGTAVLDVNLCTAQVSLIHAKTYRGSRGLLLHPALAETQGDRLAKLYSHEQTLLALFNHFQPHGVSVEAPYLGKFPQAFEALVECRTYIRRALWQYHPMMPMELIDPPTAKMAVGVVPRKGVTKDDIKRGVLNLGNLTNCTTSSIASLDEHSIDAIAVGYYKVNQLLLFLGGANVQSSI